MDHFGICAAISAMIRVYLVAARATGRTTHLVENVKDGDRIVFATRNQADRVERLCKERGVKVKCVVIEVHAPERLLETGTSEGRTIFDHDWIEKYYERAITRAQTEIDHLERETSGYGAAHRETMYRTREIHKWTL